MFCKARCVLLHLVACFLILIWPSLSHAQIEITYLRGILQSPDETNQTYTKQYEYLQELPKPFAFSLSYLNEGHLDEPDKHHRVGFVFQVWARKPVFVPWFSLAAGAGPYYWYDTQCGSSDSDKYDRGLAIIGSLGASIQLPFDGLYLQGRFNWVEPISNISTRSVLLGVGTNFSSAGGLAVHLPQISEDMKNEVLFISNSFHKDAIIGAEYRRNLGILGNHVEASLSYFLKNENVSRGYQSYGTTAQIWAVNTFKGRFKFGFGAGLFLDLLDSHYDVSHIISILAVFRISNHWNLQLSRSRIPPNQRCDEDIRTIGLGYLF